MRNVLYVYAMKCDPRPLPDVIALRKIRPLRDEQTEQGSALPETCSRETPTRRRLTFHYLLSEKCICPCCTIEGDVSLEVSANKSPLLHMD